MTIKEVWAEFVDNAKSAVTTTWDGIKRVSKETFKLLKETCINFVLGIGLWIKALFQGVWEVIWGGIKLIAFALYAALQATYTITIQKVIDWIKKW